MPQNIIKEKSIFTIEDLKLNRFTTQRRWLFYTFAFLLFADMFTTYLCLTLYPGKIFETVPWTNVLLEKFGWIGVILRFMASSIIGLFIFKVQPNIVFKYTSIPICLLLLVYALESSVNNIHLLFTVGN